MKPREASLDHDTLTRILDYDAETGIFRWKIPLSNRVKVGDVAGRVDQRDLKGHRCIQLNGMKYTAGRLAWLFVHKVWPTAEIDHVNLNADDNRISNLREVTHQQNVRNVKMRRNNKTGFKGVSHHSTSKHKFVAQITIDGKPNYLGIFDSPEDAHEAYAKASRRWHGEYGRRS